MLRWTNAGNTKSETALPGHHTKNQYVPCNTHVNWQQYPAPDPAKMHIYLQPVDPQCVAHKPQANRPWKRNNGTACPWKYHSPDTAGLDWHCPVPVGQSCESPLLQYILDCVDFFFLFHRLSIPLYIASLQAGPLSHRKIQSTHPIILHHRIAASYL